MSEEQVRQAIGDRVLALMNELEAMATDALDVVNYHQRVNLNFIIGGLGWTEEQMTRFADTLEAKLAEFRKKAGAPR